LVPGDDDEPSIYGEPRRDDPVAKPPRGILALLGPIITRLVAALWEELSPAGAILVFLPTWAALEQQYALIKAHPKLGASIQMGERGARGGGNGGAATAPAGGWSSTRYWIVSVVRVLPAGSGVTGVYLITSSPATVSTVAVPNSGS